MQSRAENDGLSSRTLKALVLSCAATTVAATVAISPTAAQTLADDFSGSCVFYFDPAETPTEEDLNRIICEQPLIDTIRPLATLNLPPGGVPGSPDEPPNEVPNEPNEPPGGGFPPHHGDRPHFPPIFGHFDRPKHHDWDWPKDHAWDWHKDKKDNWDKDPSHVETQSAAHGGWSWRDGKHESDAGSPAVSWDSHTAGSFGLSGGKDREGPSHAPADEQNGVNTEAGFAGFGSISAMGGFGAGFSGFGGWNPR